MQAVAPVLLDQLDQLDRLERRLRFEADDGALRCAVDLLDAQRFAAMRNWCAASSDSVGGGSSPKRSISSSFEVLERILGSQLASRFQITSRSCTPGQ